VRKQIPVLTVMLLLAAFERGSAQVVDSAPSRTIPVLPTRYFATGTFGPANERGDTLLQFLLGRELAGASEPSLARPGPVPSYRFAVMRAWGHLRLVRVERRDTAYMIVRKETVVDTTTPLGRRLAFADSFSVSRSRALAFEQALSAVNFWEQPPFDSGPIYEFDGYMWLLEARDERGTKVILRGVTPLGPPLDALTYAVNALAREFFPRGIVGSRAP
jgi:hypothetical protein